MAHDLPRVGARGGKGEPVFIGNWFAGLDYPGFHSWHADGFRAPEYFYRHPYHIDYQGRDLEGNLREGLVTCFHFPGYAKEHENGSWSIQSKRAVMGLGKEKGDNAELALLEYIHNTRKPTRSYTHFNNWYTLEAKEITVDNTIKKVFLPMMRNLARYGAKLDAICPDNGWQKTKGYSRIFEAKIDEKLVLDVYLTVDVEVDDQACPVEPNLPAQVSQNYRRLNQHLIHCKM